jgi:hypothetical protein
MSVLKIDLKVLQANGIINSYCIYFQEVGDSSISMQFDDGVVLKFEGQDLFCSLRLLRKYFEEKGAKVLCNGARIDAYPSGMSRSMGRGRKIYLLSHGKQARRADLVDIFDYANPEQIGSVEAQELYYKEWINSLGS